MELGRAELDDEAPLGGAAAAAAGRWSPVQQAAAGAAPAAPEGGRQQRQGGAAPCTGGREAGGCPPWQRAVTAEPAAPAGGSGRRASCPAQLQAGGSRPRGVRGPGRAAAAAASDRPRPPALGPTPPLPRVPQTPPRHAQATRPGGWACLGTPRATRASSTPRVTRVTRSSVSGPRSAPRRGRARRRRLVARAHGRRLVPTRAGPCAGRGVSCSAATSGAHRVPGRPLSDAARCAAACRPGPSPPGSMWSTSCRVSDAKGTDTRIVTMCDVWPGAGGARRRAARARGRAGRRALALRRPALAGALGAPFLTPGARAPSVFPPFPPLVLFRFPRRPIRLPHLDQAGQLHL